MSNTKDVFKKVTNENSGVKISDVRKIFMWYDLLGFGLAFQLLFTFSYIFNWKYEITMFSTMFIILVDAIVKEVLDKKPENYEKLKEELPLVKLWTIPLTIMAIILNLYLVLVNLWG